MSNSDPGLEGLLSPPLLTADGSPSAPCISDVAGTGAGSHLSCVAPERRRCGQSDRTLTQSISGPNSMPPVPCTQAVTSSALIRSVSPPSTHPPSLSLLDITQLPPTNNPPPLAASPLLLFSPFPSSPPSDAVSNCSRPLTARLRPPSLRCISYRLSLSAAVSDSQSVEKP